MTASKRLLTFVALAASIAAILIFFVLNPDILDTMEGLSLVDLVPLFAVQFFVVVANGLTLKLFSARFGIELGVLDWFGLSVVTSLGNYLAPFSGGMFARANYLKIRYGFPYVHFAAMLAAAYLMMYWVVGLVGALVMLSRLGHDEFSWPVLMFFLVVAVGITIVAVLPVFEVGWKNRLARLLASALEGWRIVRSDRTLLTKVAALTLATVILMGAGYWIAFNVLGISLPFSVALLVAMIAYSTRAVSITPGNFGIQEAATSLTSGLLGVGADTGLIVALLIRASSILLVFALGPIFSYLLSHRLIGAGRQKG